MKLRLVAAAVTSVLLGFATQSFGQSTEGRAGGTVTRPGDPGTFTHGESKRCESLSGAAKDQCDKEEATKTQGPAAEDSGRQGNSGAASGGTQSFTHGESKRCENLSAADKDQCDKEEATKTEGEEAQKASK